MPTCPARERLIVQYHDAVVMFSASISRLKACNGDGKGFAQAHRETKLARLHTENARLMLEMHRSEHDC